MVTFVSARNLRDGTVFPTTCSGNAISCVNYYNTARATGSNMAAGDLRAFISGDGGTNGAPAIAYLSDDLQTHYGTFNLAPVGGVDWPSDRHMVKAAFVSSSEFVVMYGNVTNATTVYMIRYLAVNFSTVSSGSTLQPQAMSTIQFQYTWDWHPEIVPYYNNAQPSYVGVMNSLSSTNRRIYYFNGTSNNVTTYSTFTTPDTTNISVSSALPWRAPYSDNNTGIRYISSYTSTPLSANYTNTSNNRVNFDTAYDSTLYAGYAYKNSTTVYVGHSGENKAYAVNPSTLAVSATIDMSSQAAPYRFAHHNNVLYNLNGTNIHTYSTTSNAFASTIDISNKVSGTDAVGIAHDGTNLYVLDGKIDRVLDDFSSYKTN